MTDRWISPQTARHRAEQRKVWAEAEIAPGISRYPPVAPVVEAHPDMARLPQRSREIYLLRASGMSLAEISRRYEISTERVRQLLGDARSKMK